MPNSDRSLKVIFLINELGKGGSERQLYLLLKHMDLNAAEPLVIVFNPSALTDYADSIRALGIQVLPLPSLKNSPLKRLIWLMRFLRQEKPDVVHSWSAPDNPYAGIAGLFAGVRLRMGSLRNSLQNRSLLALPLLLQKLAIHTCPYLLVNANSIREELLGQGYPANKLFLIENCVEIPTDTGVSDLPPVLSENLRFVGMVSNIRRNKNVHIFIEGFSLIADRYPNLRGVIVGQPIPDELDYYQLIQQLIHDKGLTDKIILLGFRDDAPLLVRKFEVFCLLSDFEGSPNAVLEAMAAGRPVIASNTSGIPDLVQDGVTGYLVPPGDTKAFAYALEKMLNNPNREEMGANGRKRVESNCGCEDAAARLLALYQQLLKRKK
ncbi:MAG TPA: glycosyltransferase [Anaerolineaceae bacterium]|nr:glycosyltransferase [Anaerolineaceae bacterium]